MKFLQHTFSALGLLSCLSISTPASAQLTFIEEDVIFDNEVVGTFLLPDFTEISLSDLPPVISGGSISAEFNQAVGYDLAREWVPGDVIPDILLLGDVSDAFGLENLSLRNAAELSGASDLLADITLDSFPLIEAQSINSLIDASDLLSSSLVSDNPLVEQFLSTQDIDVEGIVGSDATLEAVAELLPEISDLAFGDIEDLDFSEFGIDAILDLENIPFGEFEDWQSVLISEIPFLENVAFADFPNEIAQAGNIVSRVDFIWTVDSGLLRTVSGGNHDPEGFQVQCQQPFICPHIELDDIENLGRPVRLLTEGFRWVGGRDPVVGLFCPRFPWGVEGGFGPLKFLNICGREPTGRNPFGDAFKVVITDTDETTDTFDNAIFFRICAGDFTCSPYFIGPIPFLSLERDDFIFLGTSLF